MGDMAATWRALVGALLCSAAAAAPAAATDAPPGRPLELGPAGLPETRTVQQVERGVTLTQITRGEADPAAVWVVELNIPGGATSPDPDAPPRAIQDEPTAE